jgi:hypothetical protein
MAELDEFAARQNTGIVARGQQADTGADHHSVANDYDAGVQYGHAGEPRLALDFNLREIEKREYDCLLPINKSIFADGNIAPIVREKGWFDESIVSDFSQELSQ